jgi:hypothetical protein
VSVIYLLSYYRPWLIEDKHAIHGSNNGPLPIGMVMFFLLVVTTMLVSIFFLFYRHHNVVGKRAKYMPINH